ncbi:hypothetical protein BMS3Abin15_00274 [bacterium BMS3Abin15]|nr:hypothetical protein BMS3Abin15_00274 [bacterium BMS3Abin15]
MIFSKYGINARIAPAILCAVPFLVLYYWYLSPYLSGMFSFFGDLKIISDISFPVLLIFLLAQINRHVSKVLFQKFYFKEELYMPTTNFLLYSDNHYTKQYKDDFRDKVFTDFNIKLPKEPEEMKNELFARQRIVEAMSLVRKKCEKSKILLQHNIEYGFFRNLIGGSVIAAPLSLIFTIYCYVFIHNTTATISLGLCFILFSLLILFSKNLITEYGKAYAKILFQEYILLKI